MTIINVVPDTLKAYVNAIKENHNGVFPGAEKFDLIVLPLGISLFLLWLTNGSIAEATIHTLITIFGIFISVLVTSFTPLLDFKDLVISKPEKQSALSDSEELVNSAVKKAKNYLFAFNCMSLFLSILSIIFLFSFSYFNSLATNSIANPNWIINLLLRVLKIGFPFLTFVIILECLVNIIKTLHVVIYLFGSINNRTSEEGKKQR